MDSGYSKIAYWQYDIGKRRAIVRTTDNVNNNILHRSAEVTVPARNTGQALFKCPEPASQHKLQPVR
eukprot:4763513-Pleurochrysis_carterae.AAC.1